MGSERRGIRADERLHTYSELLSKTARPGALQRFGVVISGTATLLSIALAFLAMPVSNKSAQLAKESAAAAIERQRAVELMQAQLTKSLADAEKQRQDISSLNAAPRPVGSTEAIKRIENLEDVVATQKKDQDTLMALLGDDPAKRMAVVLLARDLGELKENTAKALAAEQARTRDDLAVIRDENKSQVDFIKWAVVFAGASNFIGPLLGFLGGYKKTRSEQNSLSTEKVDPDENRA